MAPVGGTMWAASPARNRFPNRIGSATKLRSGAIDFSIDGPVTSCVGHECRDTSRELRPEPFVGPVADRVVERALHVVAAELWVALGRKCEAARVVAVDDVVQRRRLGQDPEPAERVLLRVRADHVRRDDRPAHAVIAVASHDEVAVDPVWRSVEHVGDVRRTGGDVVRLDVGRLEVQLTAGGLAGEIEVLLDHRLAVRHDLQPGVLLDVDEEVVAPGPGDAGAVVDLALGVHPGTDPGVAQQPDRSPLEHAGADAAEDVLAALAFEHDAVDAGAVEQVREQRSGRSGTDDRDLRPQPDPLRCAVLV